MLTITGGQIRAARAILRMTAQQLADAAKVGVATVRRAEAEAGSVTITPANAAAIKSALEAAGVELLEEDGIGTGVQIKPAKER